jgi:hypothetical protein
MAFLLRGAHLGQEERKTRASSSARRSRPTKTTPRVILCLWVIGKIRRGGFEVDGGTLG